MKNGKADEARVEKAGEKKRKERKKANNRGSENDRKNKGGKGK